MTVPEILARRLWLVHGVAWRVEMVDSVDADGSVGECRYFDQIIRIRRGMSDHMTLRTLWHELAHAAGSEDETMAGHWEGMAMVIEENAR